MIKDNFMYTLRSMKQRKLRSWLMVLSILIGIAAVFTLVSFGLGLQQYINTLGEEAGVDKLFVQARGIGAPGTDENFAITKEDIDFIQKVKGVKEPAGIYTKAGEVKRDRETTNVFVSGINPDSTATRDVLVDIVQGREVKDSDTTKIALGYNYLIPDRIFKKPVEIGEKIQVNNKQFEVVGVYEELGNPADDAAVYMNYEQFESLYPASKDRFGYAIIKADPTVEVAKLAEDIQDDLRRHKNQEKGEEDFFVQTFEDALATFTGIIAILNIVLVLIALISIIVASVNIANTMYTAVIERTKEIGVMKAIGAPNKTITTIFILEAGMLGLAGGIAGVIVGAIIATLGGKAAANAGFALLQPIFPPSLIIGSLLFAFIIGAGAGFLPAKQASKLKPVDALRYE